MLNADKMALYSKRHSNCSPSSISNNDYFDQEVQTPVKQNLDLKSNQVYSEDHLSRRIDTAATDSKSLTTATDRKRIGKSAVRRKRKNIQIRKLTKKPNRMKKSGKSLAKIDPDNDCIHEKVEEENEVPFQDPNNNDLKEIDIDSNFMEPDRAYNVGHAVAIRNTSFMSNAASFSNGSMLDSVSGKKDKKKLSSIQKPANDIITMVKSPYEGRPMTVFFQYPEYWGYIRNGDDTVTYTQTEFKKQGYALSFKVTGSTHVYNSVVNSMKQAGFTMITG